MPAFEPGECDGHGHDQDGRRLHPTICPLSNQENATVGQSKLFNDPALHRRVIAAIVWSRTIKMSRCHLQSPDSVHSKEFPVHVLARCTCAAGLPSSQQRISVSTVAASVRFYGAQARIVVNFDDESATDCLSYFIHTARLLCGTTSFDGTRPIVWCPAHCLATDTVQACAACGYV